MGHVFAILEDTARDEELLNIGKRGGGRVGKLDNTVYLVRLVGK